MTRPARPRPSARTAPRPAPGTSGGSSAARRSARPHDVYIADPDYADVCAKELGLKTGPPADGVFILPAGPLRDPCFAHQVLPNARLVRGAGPNDLANTILDAHPDASLVADELQVTPPEEARHGSSTREPHPLDGAAHELLDVLHKKVVGRAAKHGPRAPSGHVLRVLVVDAWGAWVSLERQPLGPCLTAWPSRFPGGRALNERARDAPSSAYRKIDEALRTLETGPGTDDLVVDLGAAPGGWSQLMLERGARVIAVDRADLDEALEHHPRLVHVRADAFSWQPDGDPAWWLCDVIAEPRRSLEVARAALARPATRGIVFTLKLTRPVPLKVLAEARAVAEHTPGFVGRLKQLGSNKLEVSLLMRR